MSFTQKKLVAAMLCVATAVPAIAQCETQRLLSPPSVPGGSFGSGVAMADGRLLVGDPQGATRCPDPFACATGAVHAFDLVGERWEFVQTIVPADVRVGDSFAISMDVDSDTMIVGSYDSSISGIIAGGAYVYERDGGRWGETARIAPPEPTGFAGFGSSVAIAVGFAIVQQQDSVYIFEQSADGWRYLERLDPPDAPPVNSAFGAAIEIGRDWVFIGAPFDRSLEPSGGSVYVYRRDGVNLDFVQKIEPADPFIRPRLGNAIAFDGSTLFIAGYIADATFEGQGVVYRYELRGEEWILVQEITSDPPRDDAYFGADLDLHGDVLVVGAMRERVAGGLGAAYVFRRSGDRGWVQQERLVPPTSSAGFGGAVAVDDSWVIVGARDEPVGEAQPGAVHAFDLGCFLCKPDLDADGSLTVFDFLLFLNLFQDADPLADFDGDGELTIFDFLAFQTAFDAGCE